MKIPFIGGSAKGISVNANPSECVNLYPELDKEGGLNALVNTPGLEEVADLSDEELGDEIITNGDFTGNADSWTLGPGWVYSDNAINKGEYTFSGVVDGSFSENPTKISDAICSIQTVPGAQNLTINGSMAEDGSVELLRGRTVGIYDASFPYGDNSGVTFTITGTDNNDDPQEETINGPAGGPPEGAPYASWGSKSFKTITQVSSSGAATGTIQVGAGPSDIWELTYEPVGPYQLLVSHWFWNGAMNMYYEYVLGDNLVANSGFNGNADGWSPSTWNKYGGNQLNAYGLPGQYLTAGCNQLNVPIVAGKLYLCSWSLVSSVWEYWPGFTHVIASWCQVGGTITSDASSCKTIGSYQKTVMAGSSDSHLRAFIQFEAATPYGRGGQDSITMQEMILLMHEDYISQSFSIMPQSPIAGSYYKLTYTASIVDGSINAFLGGAEGTERDETGTYEEIILCGNTNDLIFGGEFTGWIDDISLEYIPGLSAAYQSVEDMAYDIYEGDTYRLTFKISDRATGWIKPILCDTEGSVFNTNGTFSIDIVVGSGDALEFMASINFDGTLDDVSLKKIIITLGEIRGMHVVNNNLYTVHYHLVKKLDSEFETTILNDGRELGTKTGPVTIAHIQNSSGDNQIMICDGSDGVAYVYDETTEAFTRINTTNNEFYGGGSTTSQDNYFISHRPNTNEFYISALKDGLTYDPLDLSLAQVQTSNILRVLSSYQELWFFKDNSVEVFVNTGSDPVFQRNNNIEIGIGAEFSLAILDNALFWLANDQTVRMARNYHPTIVSSPQILENIRKFTIINDAIGFGYVDRGHSFYQLTFPTEDKTFVYDVYTGLWHERTSFKGDGTSVMGRHRANCYAFFNNEHLIGDFINNKIYRMSCDIYDDGGHEILRKRVFRVVNEEQKRIFAHQLVVDFESGVGLNAGQGSIPKAILKISRDGGHTYGNEIWADIGAIGNYGTRAIWRRLGQGRDLVYDVSLSDPIKPVMVGAYLEADMEKT